MSISPVERRSFAQRREIFKDIWNATMLIDDGNAADVKVKPKVIKTLRLEQASHEKASVRKKRLKNLRIVCNKILAFCDNQEQNDRYYHQIGSSGKNSDNDQLRKSKTKKKKIVKKVKKSLSPSKEHALTKDKDSEKKDSNIGDAAAPINRPRKQVKTAVPMVASHSTSKLISTRSPTRRTSSPSPTKYQKNYIKKSSTKKKKYSV